MPLKHLVTNIQVSYDATEHIKKLKKDIIEYGGNTLVAAVTENVDGVTIYKEYTLLPANYNTLSHSKAKEYFFKVFNICPNEIIRPITMTSLMIYYQNEL